MPRHWEHFLCSIGCVHKQGLTVTVQQPSNKPQLPGYKPDEWLAPHPGLWWYVSSVQGFSLIHKPTYQPRNQGFQ